METYLLSSICYPAGLTNILLGLPLLTRPSLRCLFFGVGFVLCT